ncbi:MAG: DNA-protecting protein DprA [candidate division SR1 bacterium]|nr:DNA-protecting protein DprA [candidate division SR1 bacterium]
MQHEAILYSLDPKLPFSQINEMDEYDRNKYSKLEDWIQEKYVHAMIASEVDIHYKILPIRPRVQIFYYIGNITLLNQKILGIVGPRAMSLYGKQVLESLFTSAQEYDIVTISGMADGVDQLCHQLSHDYNIPTIAVLGGGLGRYMKRPEHIIIEKIVAAGGLVLSEYKLGEKPSKYTFPQRNRLIAGLADVLFLPEAGAKSGSLITVECALMMKKPVYATPSSIFSPTSAGILHLIETGSVKPIFDLPGFLATHFSPKNISSRPIPTIELSDQERGLVSVLSRDESTEVMSLVQGTGWKIQEIISILSILEIKGVVNQQEPGKYILR